MSRILVTGANGWIGRALASAMLAQGHEVWGLTRRPRSTAEGVREWLHEAPDFAGLEQQWPIGRSFETVLHLAARVHAGQTERAETFASYLESNTAATLRLGEIARQRGVARFVFLSSAKVLGEHDPGRAWREDDLPHPEDAYGISKYQAEQGLSKMTGIETVVIRSPLVYGPGVRANFARLMAAIRRGWPLPLGCANAQRSLISLDSLVDVLIRCASDIRAKGQLFHVADQETLAVRDLVLRLGELLHRPARLLPVPLPWLRAAGSLAGRRPQVDRLTEPLRLDTSLIHDTLNWRAPVSVDDALERTATWYLGLC